MTKDWVRPCLAKRLHIRLRSVWRGGQELCINIFFDARPAPSTWLRRTEHCETADYVVHTNEYKSLRCEILRNAASLVWHSNLTRSSECLRRTRLDPSEKQAGATWADWEADGENISHKPPLISIGWRCSNIQPASRTPLQNNAQNFPQVNGYWAQKVRVVKLTWLKDLSFT